VIPNTRKLRWEPVDGISAREYYLVPTVLRAGGPIAWYVCDDPTDADTALQSAYGLVWLYVGYSWDKSDNPHRLRTYTTWAYKTVADPPSIRRGSQLATLEGAASALFFHLRATGKLGKTS
jgi:hypothetical protein